MSKAEARGTNGKLADVKGTSAKGGEIKRRDVGKAGVRTTTTTTTRFPGIPDDQIITCTPTQIREWSFLPKWGGRKRN